MLANPFNILIGNNSKPGILSVDNPDLIFYMDAKRSKNMFDGTFPTQLSKTDDLSSKKAHPNQATSVLQPNYSTNAMNGFPEITFDGAADFYVVPNLNSTFTTAFFVFRNDIEFSASSTTHAPITTESNFSGIAFGPSTSGLADEIITVFNEAGGGRSGWTDGSAVIEPGVHICTFLWDGTKYRIRVDRDEKLIHILRN